MRVAPDIVSVLVSAVTPASSVQLAAVLHQLDVRVKDISLWGSNWMLAAAGNSLLEVGHKPLAM